MKVITTVPCEMALLAAISVCLALGGPAARARDFTQAEVRRAVQQWVRCVTADSYPNAEVERMEAQIVDGTTVAYTAHLLGGGFCLCGANDRVLPVYFYSPKGAFRRENPGCQAILNEIAERTRSLSKNLPQPSVGLKSCQAELDARARLWQQLLDGSLPLKPKSAAAVLIEPDQMTLPLTCEWDQDSPYNDQCPVLTPGTDEHCLVGCTATTISQIMYYWHWPPSGTGSTNVLYEYRWRTSWDAEPLTSDPQIPTGPPWSGRLSWTSANGGQLLMNGYWDRGIHDNAADLKSDSSYRQALEALYNRLARASTVYGADFGSTTYDWSQLHDVHSDPVDDGDAEVAKLCYQVAVAYQSEFLYDRVTLSELFSEPLFNFFRYDPDVIGRQYTNMDEMITVLTQEIQWLRPVAKTVGLTGGGSHNFIIYGYDKGTDPNRQFKMNLGWGPGSGGWWTADHLGAPNGYHGLLTQIAPRDVVKFVGGGAPGSSDGSPGNPYESIQRALLQAPDEATLIFAAGSDNTFSAPLLILDRPMTLRGVNVTIRSQ